MQQMARLRCPHTKANFPSKISGQSGKLGGTPGPKPKNGTIPAKTGRIATLPFVANSSIICCLCFPPCDVAKLCYLISFINLVIK